MNQTLLFQNGIFDQLKTQFFTFTYSNTLYVKVYKSEKWMKCVCNYQSFLSTLVLNSYIETIRKYTLDLLWAPKEGFFKF